MEPRRLREFRQFYLTYSKLGVEVGKYLQRNSMFFASFDIYQKWRLPTAILQITDNKNNRILRLPTAILEEWHTPPDRLFNRLSASHLIYLSNIKDDLKRAFYEQEAIRGCWTIKELDRQVSSLYYERMGVSKDKLALQQHIVDTANVLSPKEILHNPIALENLFVSKYQLQLPSEEEIRRYLIDNFSDEERRAYHQNEQTNGDF